MVWKLGRPLPGSVEEAAHKIERLLDLQEAERRSRRVSIAPAQAATFAPLGAMPERGLRRQMFAAPPERHDPSMEARPASGYQSVAFAGGRPAPSAPEGSPAIEEVFAPAIPLVYETMPESLLWAVGIEGAIGPGSALQGDAGEHERKRDEDCERLYEQDSKICRTLRTRACWASAAERLAACLKGSEIPELDTTSYRFPSPLGMPRPRPMLPPPFPMPGGGGAAVPIWRLKPRDLRM